MNNLTSATGFLKLTALSGIFLFPLENARVSVLSEEGEQSDIMTTVYTDRSGGTGPILLPAYDENYNIPTNPLRPVRTYTVTVSKEGYADAVQSGVPVFPNIVSERVVYMVPLPEQIGNRGSGFDNTIYSSDSDERTEEGRN